MPLKLVCSCNTELTIAPEHIGKNVRCGKCNAVTSTAFPTTTGAKGAALKLKQKPTRVGRISPPTDRMPVPRNLPRLSPPSDSGNGAR
jgi:hypothetical protein